MIVSTIMKLFTRHPGTISYADFSDTIADMLELGWIQHCNAKDAAGHLIDHKNKRAVQFCAGAAIWSLNHRYRYHMSLDTLECWLDSFHEYLKTTEYYQEHCETKDKPYFITEQKVTHWNDGRKQTQINVVAAFRGFATEQRELS